MVTERRPVSSLRVQLLFCPQVCQRIAADKRSQMFLFPVKSEPQGIGLGVLASMSTSD